MLTKKVIWEQLAGGHIVASLVAAMGEIFEDFPEVQGRYLSAMQMLQDTLGGNNGPSCKEEMEAIDQQIHSLVLFSGLLGLKANLDNFIDPIARSFLNVDAEVYLREETARSLPEYENAKQLRYQFYNRLSPAQQTIYEDVMEYTCYLETAGPKLAHYYGYMLGNELFPLVVPGYHPDTVQTAQYETMMKCYFGKHRINL